MKRRMPKDPVKRARRREELRRAGLCKAAIQRHRYGTLGPASPVRRIDPKTMLPID